MSDGIKRFAFQRKFTEAGDWAALDAATAFLVEHGFSVGRMQARSPRGILFGDFDIQKWRNLSRTEREELHGEMIGGRGGPVSVFIFEDCPEEGLARLPVDEMVGPPMTALPRETRLVIFFRQGMFYPLELPITDDLAVHAEHNPGTLRIEDTKGNILWRPQ